MRELAEIIEHHIANWRTGWSMGSFGAIAEFHRDEGEPAIIENSGRLSEVTARGGMALERDAIRSVVPIAYETLSPKRHRWTHALALCLPDALAKRAAGTALTEIGPDSDAIRVVDRGDTLFDLGLGLLQSDFCIRTKDPDLLSNLRANVGRSLFEPGNPALGALLSAHPHRVVITNIGRAEVYQKIGGPETGGVSPAGPHTHLLPKLLKSGRTHSANTPIPAGLVPLGAIHPGNPVTTPMGRDQSFDPGLFQAFQQLLEIFGLPDVVDAKRRVATAVDSGLAPEMFDLPAGRFPRSAARLALRQQARIAEHSGDNVSAERIAAWRRVHDTAVDEAEDDDAPGIE